MKLGKTFVSFLAVAMCFGVVACGQTNPSESVSESVSSEPEPVLRAWTEKEKLVQQIYFHTVLPEFKLPEDAVVTIPEGDNAHIYYCRMTVDYGAGDTAKQEIISKLTTAYGEPLEYDSASDTTVWVILPGGEGTEFMPILSLDGVNGVLYVMAYAESYTGGVEFLDGYFGHYYANKTFADLYPGFPAWEDTSTYFGDLALWGATDDYCMVVLEEYTQALIDSFVTDLRAAGWHIYGWTKSSGTNSVWYTKAGVSGAVVVDDSALSTDSELTLHFMAGMSNEHYVDGPIIGEDSVTEGSESVSA